jgi:hypothetical protein
MAMKSQNGIGFIQDSQFKYSKLVENARNNVFRKKGKTRGDSSLLTGGFLLG